MVFDDFVSGNISFNRSSGGTGLGLGIARRYAQALGGTLTVASEIGIGSTFTFRAPFQTMSQPGQVETLGQSGPTESMNILVVEDNEINRQVAREMLRKMGHTVSEAVDGKAGVEAADAHAYDLIFMDITMPELDGREATRAIRAGAGKSSNVPIVALTANVVEADREAFLSDGMNDVLSKPISKAKLADLLSSVFAPNPTSSTNETQLEELLELLGSDRFEETLSKFQNEGHAFSKALPTLAGQNLVEQAHQFAGSAALLGATHLHESLKSLENAAKAENLEEIDARKTDVIAAWKKTLEDIG
jgi:CheY-like chemotaxis protein